MKLFLKILFFIGVVFIIISCNQYHKENYKVVINHNADSISKLKVDFLEIIFETGFNNDLLKLNINGNKREYHIKTDMSTGYADFIELGKLSDFKELSFSVNNGELVRIKKPKYNLILVNYKKDSIIWVDFSNQFKSYK